MAGVSKVMKAKRNAVPEWGQVIQLKLEIEKLKKKCMVATRTLDKINDIVMECPTPDESWGNKQKMDKVQKSWNKVKELSGTGGASPFFDERSSLVPFRGSASVGDQQQSSQIQCSDCGKVLTSSPGYLTHLEKHLTTLHRHTPIMEIDISSSSEDEGDSLNDTSAHPEMALDLRKRDSYTTTITGADWLQNFNRFTLNGGMTTITPARQHNPVTFNPVFQKQPRHVIIIDHRFGSDDSSNASSTPSTSALAPMNQRINQYGRNGPFPNRAQIRRRQLAKKGGESCPLCGKVLIRNYVIQHMTKVHVEADWTTGIQVYRCFCKAPFPMASLLLSHMETCSVAVAAKGLTMLANQ